MSNQLWPQTWMNIAEMFAKHSCDTKTQVGAVIVPNDNSCVLSLGYNGPPHGFPHERESLEDGKSGFLHAESNAFYKLPYYDQRPRTLYTLYSPCPDCARGAIQCKISRVIYKNKFRDLSGLDILRKGKIEVYSLDEAIFLAQNNVWNDEFSYSDRCNALRIKNL